MAKRCYPIAMMFLTIAACVLSVAFGSPAQDRALLAMDKVISGAFVAGMNVTVEYAIHNVGTQTATSVQLKDVSFPASRFVTDKPTRATWPQLEGGQSIYHHVQIEPKRAGELYAAPASVVYADGEQRRVTRLAADESFVVEELLEFRRRTDRHSGTWMIYVIAFFLLGIAPFGASHMLVRGLPDGGSASKKS